jgi:hypothetical protein
MNLRLFIIVLLLSVVKKVEQTLPFKETDKRSVKLKHLQFSPIHRQCNTFCVCISACIITSRQGIMVNLRHNVTNGAQFKLSTEHIPIL